MRRFSLRILFVACVFAGALIGYFREPIARLLKVSDQSPDLVEIVTARQIENALDSPNAIIFAHIDWSTQSYIARDTVTEFALHWYEKKNTPTVDFFVLDLTNSQQHAPAHVRNWLASDPRLNGLSTRGSGDVVWLKNGAFQKWSPACKATVLYSGFDILPRSVFRRQTVIAARITRTLCRFQLGELTDT